MRLIVSTPFRLPKYQFTMFAFCRSWPSILRSHRTGQAKEPGGGDQSAPGGDPGGGVATLFENLHLAGALPYLVFLQILGVHHQAPQARQKGWSSIRRCLWVSGFCGKVHYPKTLL